MREGKLVHVGKNTGLPKERLEGCAHLNGEFFNAIGQKAAVRASSADGPVCPPLQTSCCAVVNRRFGPLASIQLDCGPDPTSPALRASSASFVKIFFPAMRPDSQAPVI